MSTSIGFGFDPDGAPGGAPTIHNATEFVWNAGATYSDGGSQAVDDFNNSGGTIITPFDTYFHTSLNSIVDTNGQTVFDPAAAGVEITMVTGFGEIVTSSGFDPATGSIVAVFGHIESPNEFFEIYYDDTPDANPTQGTGYNDGTLILRADITDVPSTFFAIPLDFSDPTNPVPSVTLLDSFFADGVQYNNLTVVGAGTTTLNADIIDINSAFFDSNVASFTFDIVSQTPYDAVTPSDAFVTSTGGEAVSPAQSFGLGLGIPGVGVGFINGAGTINGGGPDITFQSAGTTSFQVAPLPASFWENNTNLWVGYSPDMLLRDVFDGLDEEDDRTLLDALKTKRGEEKVLAREAVAALLNAAHPDVDYAVTENQIITVVSSAFNDEFSRAEVRDLRQALRQANHGDPTNLLAILDTLVVV